MKKSLGLFFFGLFAGALGIGCFATSLAPKKVQEVAAEGEVSYVEFDQKGIFKLGSYPQNVRSDLSAFVIINDGVLKQTSSGWNYYLYNNSKYVIIDKAVVDNEGSAGKVLSNNEPVNDYEGRTNVVVEFKDIEWQLLKTSNNNSAYLISTSILDREIFHNGTRVSYDESSLCDYLNTSFKEMAFDDDDLPFLMFGNEGFAKTKVTIPAKEDIDISTYDDKNLKQASDFAILKGLTSHSAENQGIGIPYFNAGYWLSTNSSLSDRVEVCWAKVAYSGCLTDDPKIGVRPVILVNYLEGGSGGSTSSSASGGGVPAPSAPSSTGGGNVTLGLGIAFMVVGAGGLIAFFIIWSKKHSTGKPPVWIIIAVAGSLVLSVSGLGCFAHGITGGGAIKIVGWYGGNMYDCVGFGERLAINVTADGKVYRYVADAWEDSATNYLFRRQAGVGTYTYSNGRLTITAAAEWHLSSWEKPVMTYTDCNGLGSFLKYEGYVGSAYSWHQYSTVDSGGVDSIRNAGTYDGGKIW